MILTLSSLAEIPALPFDEIIDVRAPLEFAEDHIPGAVNLPVLDDAERARVGTIYVQDSRFRARKIGAALVAQNAARHLQTHLADHPGSWRPLVYCWRGGQRSGSFASILEQIGWRVAVLEGGYQAYRRQVVAALYDTPIAHPFILLDGDTGTAKTALLQRLRSRGVQILDLEALAGHRGSLFGQTAAGQPPQKLFESRLAAALSRLAPDKPVIVEAESSKIGCLNLPKAIWTAMCGAARIRIQAPVAARAAYLVAAYADIIADPVDMARKLDALAPFHSGDRIASWKDKAHRGDFTALARDLITDHYDPRYRKSQSRHRREDLAQLAPADLAPATLDRAADDIARLAARVPGHRAA